MSETLFDPSIHQSAAPLAGYYFDASALVERLRELKESPTPEMIAFLKAHPEYKEFNCAALAEYCGLSEPALKKLKRGQTADPRGSTFWILFNKFGIRPREVLKCIPPNMCNVECANKAKLKLDEVIQQNAKLESQHAEDQKELTRLRLLVLEHSNAASKARAEIDAMHGAAKESEARISRRDKGVKSRNMIIIVLSILLVVFMALAFYFLWEAMHPYAGMFRA